MVLCYSNSVQDTSSLLWEVCFKSVTKVNTKADRLTDHRLLICECSFRILRKKKCLKLPTKLDCLMSTERKERLEQFLNKKLPECKYEWDEFKTLLQDAAKHTFEKKKKVSNDWFDDNDEEIRKLLENKRINRNELRERIRSLKNRWYQEQAEKAERYAEAKNHRVLCCSQESLWAKKQKFPPNAIQKRNSFCVTEGKIEQLGGAFHGAAKLTFRSGREHS